MTLDIGILGYRFTEHHLFTLGSAALTARAKTWAKKPLTRRRRTRGTTEMNSA